MHLKSNTDKVLDFAPKSETESICLRCFLTVKADAPHTLKMVEEIHSHDCSNTFRLHQN